MLILSKQDVFWAIPKSHNPPQEGECCVRRGGRAGAERRWRHAPRMADRLPTDRKLFAFGTFCTARFKKTESMVTGRITSPTRSLRKADTGGFTLVELVAISVLVTGMLFLLLPTLARAKQKTIAAGCQSNLRQIGLALQNYAAANSDSLPGPLCLLVDPRYDPASTNQLAWFVAERLGMPRPGTVETLPVLKCPAQGAGAPDPTKPHAHYILNDGRSLDHSFAEPPFGRVMTPVSAPLKLSAIASVTRPASCCAMVDADKGNVNPTLTGWNDLPCQPSHSKVRNELFFDWHVAARSW